VAYWAHADIIPQPGRSLDLRLRWTGYVPQWTWWRLGFVASVLNLVIWTVLGSAWWKALGWW
jgi:hypothetical protein